MPASEYTQWLKRGRNHQWNGRAIDAMLCFRRAQRTDPRRSDAPFHLGEVLRQLGLVPEAIAAWRDAVAINSGHLAPSLALAEALLGTGDLAGAAAAADAALRIAPDDAHAAIIATLARLLQGGVDARDTDGLRHFERDRHWLEVPAISGALGAALDRSRDLPGRDGLLAVLASAPAPLAHADPRLLALVIEAAAGTGDAGKLTALSAVARDRGYQRDEYKALRRIAAAVARFDPAIGAELRARYAALCVEALLPAVPLVWPIRTAGKRLRVVVLLAAAAIDGATRAPLATLATLPRDVFDIALATTGRASPEVISVARAMAAAVAELPPAFDATVAKALAARDFDVLLDLAGAVAAPLVVQRPARAVYAVEATGDPNRPPLVDRVFTDDAALVAELVVQHDAHDVSRDCELDATALAALWGDAVRAHQRGDAAAAQGAYSRLLDLQPGFAPGHYLRGVLARDLGDLAAARADFANALAAAPDYVDARIAAAGAATAMREPAAAVALCEEGLARAPDSVGLWRALGLALLKLRKGTKAAAAFERAVALAPDDAETHYNHGVALQMQRLFNDAARAYRRALAFKPSLVDADYNLGVLFQQQDALEAAIQAYETVLKSDPTHVLAYKNLGEALLAAGKFDAWVANFERFEANCPDALPLAVQALEVCQYLGDFDKVDRYLDVLRSERFRVEGDAQLADCLEVLLYLLLYFDVEPELLLKLAQTYDVTAKRIYGVTLPRRAKRKPGRLRVGYLSADLRNHVMGKMIWQAIAHHDKSRFELYFYSLAKTSDEWTERFRGIADHFEVLAGRIERAGATRIAKDDLDILVDLSTHTKGAKPGILAFKPARVQVTHVASAGIAGLSAVDFKLTDAYADLPEAGAYQLETPLVMEGCVYPYRHIVVAQMHPFHRPLLDIAADTVVIGAFVSGLKLSRRCLALWREVLERVPRAKLAFSPVNPGARALYLRLAAAGGIADDRLLFLPQGRDDAENQARYSVVDFVLDTMPFGGVNGTLEALDMGVPVVTLAGRRHGERSSYSILANLGVTETVAHSGREYVDIAVRLADAPEFMAAVRDRIREGLEGSTLIDMAAHTRHLEAAYVEGLAARCPEVLSATVSPDV
jgi:predicted O-linked N-acetylglucosamine transferase (SPINDLY family)